MAKRPRNRRDTLLTAAAGLFAQRGFSAVSLADIGQAVGISGQAVYAHFKDKGAVLDAVLAEAVERVAAATATITAGDDLAAMVGEAVALVLDRRDELTTYLRERHRVDGATGEVLRAHEAAMLDDWRRAVRTAHPRLADDVVTGRLVGMLGAVSGASTLGSGVARERLEQLVAEGALGLLAAAAASPRPAPRAAAPRWEPPMSRRAEILAAAIALFRRHGYNGVGIDEIGAAVGITGPGVYHHFAGKSDILAVAYVRLEARSLAGALAAVEEAGSAQDALQRLVRSYVKTAFDDVDLLIVTRQEGWWLPEQRDWTTSRVRDIEEIWLGVLRAVRPELTETDARIVAGAAAAAAAQMAQLPERMRPAQAEAAAAMLGFLAAGVSGRSSRSSRSSRSPDAAATRSRTSPGRRGDARPA